MRTNQDFIAQYLALCPSENSMALFNRFYGIIDSRFHHDKWKLHKVVPIRLNNWCEERCKALRIERAGIRAVHTNPVMEGVR